ncbi:MAG: hypothetical protein KVP17_003679 [Porospora cf. gigantea B]|uniref:uncharacterized protein n=1 Tax=Porospora cf. gigantea B TaxID=2853592 RepID=UPI003571D4AF|nr:MAG: hypothetical protein KVP17_003679 [Porospora cf. gigantea B]
MRRASFTLLSLTLAVNISGNSGALNEKATPETNGKNIARLIEAENVDGAIKTADEMEEAVKKAEKGSKSVAELIGSGGEAISEASKGLSGLSGSVDDESQLLNLDRDTTKEMKKVNSELSNLDKKAKGSEPESAEQEDEGWSWWSILWIFLGLAVAVIAAAAVYFIYRPKRTQVPLADLDDFVAEETGSSH